MLQVLGAILPGLFNIGDKLIEDKDKKAEFAFKVQEMAYKQMEVLMGTKTYPWIDGLVKLAYAGEVIIKGLFRPIAATGLFLYGLYNPEQMLWLQDNLGVIGDGVVATVFGALPAWGVDRGLDKRKKKKQPTEMDW
jgi:hypothetical protein